MHVPVLWKFGKSTIISTDGWCKQSAVIISEVETSLCGRRTLPPDWNRVTHLKSCESFFCVPMHNFPSKWHGLSHLCTLDPINNKLFFWGANLWNISSTTCYYFCHNIYYLETLKVNWLCSGVANLPSMYVQIWISSSLISSLLHMMCRYVNKKKQLPTQFYIFTANILVVLTTMNCSVKYSARFRELIKYLSEVTKSEITKITAVIGLYYTCYYSLS